MMRTLTIAVLIAFFSALSTPASSACERIPFSDASRPTWTISGAWGGANASDLILVDSIDNTLLRYERGEEFSGTHSRLISAVTQYFNEDERPFHPTRLLPAGDAGYWLELTGGSLVHVSTAPEIRVTKQINVIGLRTASGGEIGSLFGWAVAGDKIVAFGDVRVNDTKQWQTGFYQVDVESPHTAAILRTLDANSPEQVWYRFGGDFITSIGETAYLLTMDQQFVVWRISEDSPSMESVLKVVGTLESPPLLPDFTRPEDFVATAAFMEKATAITGLYGWGESLYVVWRMDHPRTGQQFWFLTELLPNKKSVTKTMVIPSHADHLTVIPGPTSWAFVEKGPIQGYGIQRAKTILTIEASEIRRTPDRAWLCK